MIIEKLDDDTIIKLHKGKEFEYNKRTKTLRVPIRYFMSDGEINELKDLNFNFFNEEINANTVENYKRCSIEEWRDFIKFAKIFGCFSDKKIHDKSGKETSVIIGQKATMALRDMIGSNTLKISDFSRLLINTTIDENSDEDFIKFLSQNNGRKKFKNLEMLLNLELKYPGIFSSVMTAFKKAKKYRDSIDKNGKPIRLPWDEAFKKFFQSVKYYSITEDNEDIAAVFAENGLSQEIFDEASVLRLIAIDEGVSDHILEKPIKEESIMETIERIQANTDKELLNGKKIIEKLFEKKFTYEWLSKNDPRNFILGLYTNCCGTITSDSYGQDIVRASITEPDVQNLVVKDIDGNIISKGTVYVNTVYGYAVINDFELNQRYKSHEKGCGHYNVADDSKDEQEREQIFNAFMRGLQAFIQEYDRQHSDNPIQQISVGMGYNRLKRQIERFKRATYNLRVPIDYQFLDAEANQYILYDREEMIKKSTKEINEKGENEL